MPFHPFRARAGQPVYQKAYQDSSYLPKVIETAYRLQIVAPDTPYVGAAGKNKLSFIDTRFDRDTAQHMKTPNERAMRQTADEYFKIDDILGTAEVVNRKTGETIFVFDPVYARIFAKWDPAAI